MRHFRVFILLFLSWSSVAKALVCAQVYHKQSTQPVSAEAFRATMSATRGFLKDTREPHFQPTVRWSSTDSKSVTLKKEVNDIWQSTFEYVEGSKTPQGDVRYPIALLGLGLATRLGFEIRQTGLTEITIRAPSAPALEKLVLQINENLKIMGEEPISFLPIKAGFASAEEVLKMAAHKDGDILMKFPYADAAPKLTAHEISFHLGSIVFPKKFLQKSLLINQATMQFVDYLKERESDLGPSANQIAEMLMKERAYELDYGTANIISLLGFARLREGITASFEDIWLKIKDETQLIYAADSLVRPGYTAMEALLMRLAVMNQINPGGFGLMQSKENFSHRAGKKDLENLQTQLSVVEKSKLVEIVQDFINLNKDNKAFHSEIEGAMNLETMLSDFILSLDSRLLKISEAADQL